MIQSSSKKFDLKYVSVIKQMLEFKHASCAEWLPKQADHARMTDQAYLNSIS